MPCSGGPGLTFQSGRRSFSRCELSEFGPAGGWRISTDEVRIGDGMPALDKVLYYDMGGDDLRRKYVLIDGIYDLEARRPIVHVRVVPGVGARIYSFKKGRRGLIV